MRYQAKQLQLGFILCFALSGTYSKIIGGFVLPHGGVALDPKNFNTTNSTERAEAFALHKACLQVGQDISDLQPEVIVLSTPHGIADYRNFIVYLNSQGSGFGDADDCLKKPCRYYLNVSLDQEIARQLFTKFGYERNVSGLSGFGPVGNDEAFPLRWGEVIPLLFINGTVASSRIVVVSQPTRRYTDDVSMIPELLKLGGDLYDFLEDRPERIAVVISADLAHTHKASGPYGYSNASEPFDLALGRWAATLDHVSLLDTAARLVDKALSCGYTGLVMLHDESRICGGELRDSFGSLESLDSNNDGRFDKGQDCLWTLITTIDKLIEITILEYDIRSLRTYEDKTCINDFLEIYEKTGVRGKYCQTSADEIVLTSFSNKIYVNFASRSDLVIGSGFRLEYVHVDGGLSGCASGINLEYYNGTNILTDGGRRCQEWSKQTPHSHPLWSTDAEFPFDESIDAANKFCRNNGESIPWCYTWDPDKRIEYCGTQICGVATCGGFLRDSAGSFTSKDQDGDGVFDRGQDCLWSVIAPKTYVILLKILRVDARSAEPYNGIECEHEYLMVYDYSGIYGKFCNVTTETVTIRSVKNYVWVRFYSDSDRVLGSGINVAYKHVSEVETTTWDGDTTTWITYSSSSYSSSQETDINNQTGIIQTTSSVDNITLITDIGNRMESIQTTPIDENITLRIPEARTTTTSMPDDITTLTSTGIHNTTSDAEQRYISRARMILHVVVMIGVFVKL